MPDETALLQSVRELIDLLEPQARAPQETPSQNNSQACSNVQSSMHTCVSPCAPQSASVRS